MYVCMYVQIPKELYSAIQKHFVIKYAIWWALSYFPEQQEHTTSEKTQCTMIHNIRFL